MLMASAEKQTAGENEFISIKLTFCMQIPPLIPVEDFLWKSNSRYECYMNIGYMSKLILPA